MKFEHETTGNVLKLLLLVTFISSIILFIMDVIFYFIEDLYFLMSFIDQGATIFFLYTWIVACITYLIWIFRIHHDFKKMDTNYPISSGGALARILVPFYNLYGLWHVYSTMARFFNKEDKTALIAHKLKTLIPFYYFLLIITSILDRFVTTDPYISYEIILLSYLLDVFLMYVLYAMVKTVIRAMNEWRSHKEKEDRIREEEDIITTDEATLQAEVEPTTET